MIQNKRNIKSRESLIPMLRLKRTPESISLLFSRLAKPFVMVIENVVEDCGGCLEKGVYPGKSFMFGTHEAGRSPTPDPISYPIKLSIQKSVVINPIEVDRRARVLFIETIEQWKIAQQMVESFRANTVLYAQTSDWEGIQKYIQAYNPFFQELIELSLSKKVYGIKLEDLKRTFSCKTAWENKDWICIEESEGEIPGANQDRASHPYISTFSLKPK